MPLPAVRFRVDFGPGEAVGPGKISLLERIGRGSSLSGAARELKMSYRRAWLLLESLNGSFAKPVALTSKGGRGGGGGTTLTPLGRELVRLYRTFDRQLQSRAARHFRSVQAQARAKSPVRGRAPVVRLSGR